MWWKEFDTIYEGYIGISTDQSPHVKGISSPNIGHPGISMRKNKIGINEPSTAADSLAGNVQFGNPYEQEEVIAGSMSKQEICSIIEELSKDERTLLTMDTLCLLGHSIVDNPSVSFLGDDMKMKIGSIIKQRTELSVKLLDLDLEDFSTITELMEYIENTRYVIRNFQKDCSEH